MLSLGLEIYQAEQLIKVGVGFAAHPKLVETAFFYIRLDIYSFGIDDLLRSSVIFCPETKKPPWQVVFKGSEGWHRLNQGNCVLCGNSHHNSRLSVAI